MVFDMEISIIILKLDFFLLFMKVELADGGLRLINN